MAENLKPCPFCGGAARLKYHQSRYFGQNCFGAKKIKFTGYIVCNKCLSRGKPVSITSDKVNCCGWLAELEEKMFPLAAEVWNRRPQVQWSQPGPCPITPEQFDAIYADDSEEAIL